MRGSRSISDSPNHCNGLTRLTHFLTSRSQGNHSARRTYIIAEMSANHNQSLGTARELIHAMKDSGADAVKLQTYTAETMTIDCSSEDFQIASGTLWDGERLFDLYERAHTPWEWHAELFELANKLGMDCFSTPFDRSAVDFLEQFDPPAHKIASFELVDIPLIEYVASKGRPIIMSTGMGSLEEVKEAVDVIKSAGTQLVILKCTSAYPAPPDAMNLATIPDLADRFDVFAGLSDHTLGIAVPVAAVAMGARVIEKHFTLSRRNPSPDSAFSLEPQEFKQMVEAVRVAEKAVGNVHYEEANNECSSRQFRRSLYVTANVKAGDELTEANVRSIRPSRGLPPKHLPRVLGMIFKRDLPAGTPLSWDAIEYVDS